MCESQILFDVHASNKETQMTTSAKSHMRISRAHDQLYYFYFCVSAHYQSASFLICPVKCIITVQ